MELEHEIKLKEIELEQKRLDLEMKKIELGTGTCHTPKLGED